MVLNIIFLAGGICIGYLIRGEVQRKKADKAMGEAIDAGIELAKVVLGLVTNDDKKEDEIEEADDEISFDALENLFHVENSSNSSDETIKL